MFLEKIFPFFKYLISGESMSPTLKPGQNILVNRLTYVFAKPKVGDIIALKDLGSKKVLIKRISKTNKDNYFVLGDNEKQSTDSRVFGWIKKKDIIGKVIFSR